MSGDVDKQTFRLLFPGYSDRPAPPSRVVGRPAAPLSGSPKRVRDAPSVPRAVTGGLSGKVVVYSIWLSFLVERIRLVAPTLILYEVTNAVVQAMRRERITAEQGEDALAAFDGLGIEMEPMDWRQIWPLARRFDRSAYDAAYLALAQARDEPLVTGDRRRLCLPHCDRGLENKKRFAKLGSFANRLG